MDNAGEFSRLRLLNVIASSKSLLPSEVRVTGSEVEDIWGDVLQPPAVTIPSASGIQGTGLDERWLPSNPNLRIPCVLSVGHQRARGCFTNLQNEHFYTENSNMFGIQGVGRETRRQRWMTQPLWSTSKRDVSLPRSQVTAGALGQKIACFLGCVCICCGLSCCKGGKTPYVLCFKGYLYR